MYQAQFGQSTSWSGWAGTDNNYPVQQVGYPAPGLGSYNMDTSNPSSSSEATQAVAMAISEYQHNQSSSSSSSTPGRINHDYPPLSRIFIVCSKNHREDEMRQAFNSCGNIEDVWMVKDRMTKENKGICYIKFDKASSAAYAIETMDGKVIGGDPKPVKVMIASSKNSQIKTDYNDESARTRLFVICPKDFNEEDLRLKFEQFGDFDYCNIIRDRQTGESKGFGYVKFHRASTAAVAMEKCDKSLKAILAEPKSAKFARDAATAAVRDHQQRVRESYPFSASPTHSTADMFQNYSWSFNTAAAAATANALAEPGANSRLYIIVSPTVTQEQLARLFDIVPGMEYVDLKCNHTTGESRGFAYVTYNSTNAAMYAKEKLNGFEYPPGIKLIVKYAEDPPNVRYGPPSPTFDQACPLYHSAPHSPVRSPVRSVSPVRPMGIARQRRHSLSSEYDGRVFFICNPQPPADHLLRDIFSRFGILTDVWMVRGKNYGYAKFTSRSAAEAAITALHGMEVYGVRLKVMLADPPPEEGLRNKRPKTHGAGSPTAPPPAILTGPPGTS